jgi:hypothetical protein
MGKEPFGSGRSSTFDTIASDEQIAECRWGYQCSVCLLAGDLLCCEVRPPGPHTQPQPLWLPSPCWWGGRAVRSVAVVTG